MRGTPAASAPVLTPGTATVTLDTSGEWSPGGVTGANPLLPLVFRVYGNGGSGGMAEEGSHGSGGGGGAFVAGSRAAWTAEDSFAIVIGEAGVPNTTVVGNTPTVSDVSLRAGGGVDATGTIIGLGSEDYLTTGLTLTDTRAGGPGGYGSPSYGGGGGASGSTGGAGGAGVDDAGGQPAAADGGAGGNGQSFDNGEAGSAPGGGGSGAGDGMSIGIGANGRVVILVPTLT